MHLLFSCFVHQPSSAARTQSNNSQSVIFYHPLRARHPFILTAHLAFNFGDNQQVFTRIGTESRIQGQKDTMPPLAHVLQFSLFLLTALDVGTASASPIRRREASPQILVPIPNDSPESYFPGPPCMAHGSPMNPPLLPLPPIPTVPLPPLPPPGQLLARDENRPPRLPRPRVPKSPIAPMKELPRASPTTSDPEAQAEGVVVVEVSYESEPHEGLSSGCHPNTKRDEELGHPLHAHGLEEVYNDEPISTPGYYGGHDTLEEVFDDDEPISVPGCTGCTHVGELADEIEREELCDDGERLHILCSRLSKSTDL